MSMAQILRPLHPIQDSGVFKVSRVEPAPIILVGSDVVHVVWSSRAHHIISQDHRATGQKIAVLQRWGWR